jgi:hypothetical protein
MLQLLVFLINYFDEKILCAFTEDGYIYTFKIEENCLSGKHLLTTKAHEKEIISADNNKYFRK